MFVRFGGCNLRCDYCDTVGSLSRAPACDVDGRAEPNPIPLARLLGHLERLDSARGPHGSVSCTGGEPLLQAEFLAAFLPEARRRGWRTYLETNGMWPESGKALTAVSREDWNDVSSP